MAKHTSRYTPHDLAHFGGTESALSMKSPCTKGSERGEPIKTGCLGEVVHDNMTALQEVPCAGFPPRCDLCTATLSHVRLVSSFFSSVQATHGFIHLGITESL